MKKDFKKNKYYDDADADESGDKDQDVDFSKNESEQL